MQIDSSSSNLKIPAVPTLNLGSMKFPGPEMQPAVKEGGRRTCKRIGVATGVRTKKSFAEPNWCFAKFFEKDESNVWSEDEAF